MGWYALLLIPLILIVILYRTFRFTPKDFPEMKKLHPIDEKHAIESLSKMLTFKTVSSLEKNKEDTNEFVNFRTFIKERYPHILNQSTYEDIERGMLFKITGESSEHPIVLMSHYDVVPAQEGWKEHPFSGRIDDVTVYGRGALDTKSSLNAIMESVEYLLTQGKKFKNDLYLAFSGDEEIFGPSAPAIVKTLKSRGVTPFLVLDEGGAIVKNMFPGVKEKSAVVGIAEKGFMNVTLTARSRGGHASTPPKESAITELAKAIRKLNNHPSFRLKMTPAVHALFETIAPHSKSFFIKMLFANLWLFMPLVKVIAKLSGGEFLSMFKTTQAFTLATGSEAINVLPAEAVIGINYRLRPKDTGEMVMKRIRKIIKNPNIDVTMTALSEATPTSELGDAFNMLKKAINQTWPDVIVAPYLMVATTDSRHYHQISDHVYKFSPMDVSKDDLKKIHGFDEDISIDNIIHGVQFYINLLESL